MARSWKLFLQKALGAEPVLKQARPLVEHGIAFAETRAVRAVRKDVQFRGNSSFEQLLNKIFCNQVMVEDWPAICETSVIIFLAGIITLDRRGDLFTAKIT